MKKKISNEELARMIANGFADSKEDLNALEARLSQKIGGLANRTEKNEDDIRVIKTRVGIS